jgi:hypothetical protein
MTLAVCTNSGVLVERVASLPLADARCPFCGARLRQPTAAEWPRPPLCLVGTRSERRTSGLERRLTAGATFRRRRKCVDQLADQPPLRGR